MQTVALLSTLLAALRGTAALRLSQEPPIVDASADQLPPNVMERKQRQVMYNYADLQYYAYLTIGGQPITGLLDTGSFDLVVFDHACASCGTAAKYSSSQSHSFKAGVLTQSLNYGSGSVSVHEAADEVALGPYGGVNLTFWNGMEAMMPVLQNAAFNSIVGVGPPETSGADAWSVVQDEMQDMKVDLQVGPNFPGSQVQEELETATDLAALLGTQPTLVKADDVAHFSVCLGQKPGSVGYFIWNDTSYLETPSLFTQIKVLGSHTWTVNMTSLQLDRRGRHSEVLACKTGCGAIVDSGTSLLLMPFSAIYALRDQLQSMKAKCDDLRTLPRLTFKLDGKEFSLPPDAYITRLTSPAASAVARGSKNYHSEIVRLDFGGGDCQLAVMGSRTETRWGPLWILGMPFFRKYYTTFFIGDSTDSRALYVAPASDDCTPATGSKASPSRSKPYKRLIDPNKVHVPNVVQKARSQKSIAL
mmetsp:Transcript_59821/g.144506  ORF Transcript_59821/g.144506 Transcript_59821/m.144506 type:complete len:475 (+) Transcript_59821:61-1485(+)